LQGEQNLYTKTNATAKHDGTEPVRMHGLLRHLQSNFMRRKDNPHAAAVKMKGVK
jgi:hypothetical protein